MSIPWSANGFAEKFWQGCLRRSRAFRRLLFAPSLLRNAHMVDSYALRHTFFTEGLANGVDAVVLAELGGHRDLTMVARTYGHLAKKHEFLRANLDNALTNYKRPPRNNEDPTAT